MLLVGAGRIGAALRDAGTAGGWDCTLVDRTRNWEVFDGATGGPILLCVRNDDLDQVVARIPQERWPDLVFVQNGALRTWLSERHLMACTRGLLYFAVARRGDPISPGATSWVTGPHGVEVARFLGDCGARAEAVDWARFSVYELEKMAWLAVFGPLCEKHDATVGQVAQMHRDEVAALARELCAVGRATMNVDPDVDWMTDRLCDYSASIADYRASVKEWSWRNGWFIAQAEASNIDTPIHRSVLVDTGHLERA